MQAKFLSRLFIMQILGTLLIVLNSCKKEATIKESKMDLLTGTKWQLTNLYHQEVGDNTISDFLSVYYNNCELDDSYHFTKDHSFFRRDSTKTCSAPPHFGLYGGSRWAADSAFLKIAFTSQPYSYNMEIKTLNETTLELNHSVIDYFLNKVIFTYRFRAIP